MHYLTIPGIGHGLLPEQRKSLFGMAQQFFATSEVDANGLKPQHMGTSSWISLGNIVKGLGVLSIIVVIIPFLLILII